MKKILRRSIASLIDFIIIFTIYKATLETFNTPIILAILNAVIFQFCIATFVFNNATIGKKIMKLDICYSYENKDLTTKNIITLNFAREFLKWMMLINTSFLIVFAQVIFIFISNENISLYDWALKSRVFGKEINV